MEGYDFSALIETLNTTTEIPAEGTVYVPSDPELEKLAVFEELRSGLFGGLAIELGYCNGTNSKLNCVEYHRGSELNVAADDIVLMLAERKDLSEKFEISSDKVKAFKVPAGTGVLLYETSMHYAPARPSGSFRVAVGLPRGTNTEKPDIRIRCAEDKLLWANNKWLVAHKDTSEAAQGAWVGLTGTNIDIASDM